MQPQVRYIPPDEQGPRPPKAPRGDRTVMWVGLAMGAVLIVALAVIIPLALAGGQASTSTSDTTSTTVAGTTTTVAPTTTTAAAVAVGDSSGSWLEVTSPGDYAGVQEVAVSEQALLLVTTSAGGYKLSAVMFASGDVIDIAESEVLGGIDIDGQVAVWWEGSGWDAATEVFAQQYIKSCRLPDAQEHTLATGGAARLSGPQIASSWVAWVRSEPWADDPDYQLMRIFGRRVDGAGNPQGAAVTLVPSALAFTLGDSSWHYSLSGDYLAWETHAASGGYDPGTHVVRTDFTGHRFIGSEAFRPSLWGDVLLYQDGSLKQQDLGADDTRQLDGSGDFGTAGPTFALFYKPGGSGSQLVSRGYGRLHEQILADLPEPPYFCPLVSVSSHHVAYARDEQVHLFEWRAGQ